MDEVRRAIARIVETHLEEILDRTMDAFAAEIPAVAAAAETARRTVRASTKRAITSFITLYADPNSPARVVMESARAATLDRAGELFERDDILSMIAVARQVVYQSTRGYVRAALEVDPALEKEITQALTAFLDELEHTESLLVRPEDGLHRLLATAEAEGPDLR